jgi:hypothetical protein
MSAPGDRIGGRYEIVAPISEGAMGAVCRARDRSAENGDVAVKQLVDIGQWASFEIEARLLAGLRHPRVVRVLDYVSEGRDSFLVMELIRGPDLGRALEERGSPGLPLQLRNLALRPLPKALDDLAAVQRADLYPATPVHEGWEILPGFDRLPPVLGDASGCLVDLAEDEDGVAGELRVRVDRIRALGTLRDLVGQEGGVTIARVSSHPIDVALKDPIALGDVIRTNFPHDDDVCLPDVGHRLPPLRHGGRRSALLASFRATVPPTRRPVQPGVRS